MTRTPGEAASERPVAPPTPARHAAARRQVLSDYLILAALWGSSFLFMRLGASEFGALTTAGLRVGGAALCLLPLLVLQGQWPALRAHLLPALAVGVVNSALPFALLSWAVLSITTGLASILNATVPMFGAIVAWVWLGDRLSPTRTAGLLIGFAGIVALGWDQAEFRPGGTGWAVLGCLAATLCYAIGASFTKRYLTRLPPLAAATGSQLGATIALALPAWWWWPAATPSTRAWGAVAALALLCTATAYWLYFRLIGSIGPARAVTVTYLIPVVAVGYGWLLLGEAVTPWMLGCGAVIVLGTALSSGVADRRG